jgi:hypothetical protein
MQSLSIHPTAAQNRAPDLESEIKRLEARLAEKQCELKALQEETRAFKLRYTQTVGARLAELEEVELSIVEAEERVLGAKKKTEEADASAREIHQDQSEPSLVRISLRKLFWSVAKVFHPDHAADEEEARRRHSIMSEASRAYREGDVESLHTLLSDEHLRSYCASAAHAEDEEDLGARLISLKEELRTVEFGLRRLKQDGLYHLKLKAEEMAGDGHDMLREMSERIQRQITKARRRLEHLS